MQRKQIKTKTPLDSATKIFSSILNFTRIIGRPFYYILSSVVITVLFTLYFIGHITTFVPNKIVELSKKPKPKPKVKPGKTSKKPKPFNLPKIVFPKITFPKLEFKLKSKFKFPKFKKIKFKALPVRIITPRFKAFISKVVSPSLKAFIVLILVVFAIWMAFFKDLPPATDLTTRKPASFN